METQPVTSVFAAVINARFVANYGHVGMFTDAHDANGVIYVRTQDLLPYIDLNDKKMIAKIHAKLTPLYYDNVYIVAICVQRMIDLGGTLAELGALCAQIAKHALSISTVIGEVDCADSEHDDSETDNTIDTPPDSYPGILVIATDHDGALPQRYVYGSYCNMARHDDLLELANASGYKIESVEIFTTLSYRDAQIIEREVYSYTILDRICCSDKSNLNVAYGDVTGKIKNMLGYMADL